MIDIRTETPLPFGVAVRRLPSLRSGRPVNPSTLWRWATVGVKSRATGERVKLETIRVGGSSATTIEALQRFFDRLGGQEPEQSLLRAPSKGHARAETALDTAGI